MTIFILSKEPPLNQLEAKTIDNLLLIHNIEAKIMLYFLARAENSLHEVHITMGTTTTCDQEALAIQGGTPVRSQPMPVRKVFGLEEKQAVMDLFDLAIAKGSHFLGYNGPQEEAYCREFADFLGGGFADGVNSGTNAVHVAVRALELEPYSEVIVPPVSDAGGIMPVAMANLIPVPADAAPGSFNTSAEQIEKRLTAKTRAIMVAHIAGIPVDMDPVMELAAKHGLPVIEDAAQAHGTEYKGRKVGSIGTIAAFSTMFGKQHCTGGQGGVVFTTNQELYWKIRQHADRGKPFGVSLSGSAGAGVGAAASAGNNLLAALNNNMDELHACVGRVQLRRLPKFLEQRRRVAGQIAAGCRECSSVEMIVGPNCPGCPDEGGEECTIGCKPSFWFLIFRFNAAASTVDKATFVEALRAEGIPFDPTYLYVPTRQPWSLAHHVFGDGSSALPWSAAGISHLAPPLPEADATDANHFRLSFHEGWGETEAADVAAALCKVDAAFRRS